MAYKYQAPVCIYSEINTENEKKLTKLQNVQKEFLCRFEAKKVRDGSDLLVELFIIFVIAKTFVPQVCLHESKGVFFFYLLIVVSGSVMVFNLPNLK